MHWRWEQCVWHDCYNHIIPTLETFLNWAFWEFWRVGFGVTEVTCIYVNLISWKICLMQVFTIADLCSSAVHTVFDQAFEGRSKRQRAKEWSEWGKRKIWCGVSNFSHRPAFKINNLWQKMLIINSALYVCECMLESMCLFSLEIFSLLTSHSSCFRCWC